MAKRIVSALGKFSNSTVTGNDDTYKEKGVADYTIAKKSEGSYKTKRILFIVALIVFVILLCVGGYLINPFVVLAGLALSGIGIRIVWYFLHRYLEIEYSYAIQNAELICTEIYGNKSDKLLLRTRMSTIEKVVPYEGSYKTDVDSENYEKTVDIRSTPSTDQAYAVVYRTESGKGLVLLEACDKTLEAFYYYNKSTVLKKMKR